MKTADRFHNEVYDHQEQMAKEDKTTAIYIAYEDYEPADSALAEKNLLRAILAGALSDIKKAGDEKRRATEFFLSPDDDYIFSFLSICNHLDIDPHHVLVVTGLKKRLPGDPEPERDPKLFENELLD